MKVYLSKYKRSVIVGMWRQGATLEQIAVHQNIPYDKVKVVVETYFKIKFGN